MSKTMQINDFEFDLKEINVSTFMLTCCSCCGKLVPFGKYCVSCGELMKKDIRTVEAIRCRTCGKNTPKGGNYCVSCGKEIHHL